MKTKGYSFSTSAACHNDNNPHAPPTPPEAASDEANPAQDVSESEKVLKKNSFEGYLNTDDAKDNQSSNAENPLVKENEQKKEATSSSSKTINSPQTYVLLSLVFVLFSVIV